MRMLVYRARHGVNELIDAILYVPFFDKRRLLLVDKVGHMKFKSIG